MEKETCRLKETNFSKNKKIIDKNLINICPKVKNTTYIAEITIQKKEKCLSGWGRGEREIHSLDCLCAGLVSTKKFST